MLVLLGWLLSKSIFPTRKPTNIHAKCILPSKNDYEKCIKNSGQIFPPNEFATILQGKKNGFLKALFNLRIKNERLQTTS